MRFRPADPVEFAEHCFVTDMTERVALLRITSGAVGINGLAICGYAQFQRVD
jgi:hypothetical protein